MLAKGIYSSSAITYKALTNNNIILLRGSTSSWSTPTGIGVSPRSYNLQIGKSVQRNQQQHKGGNGRRSKGLSYSLRAFMMAEEWLVV